MIYEILFLPHFNGINIINKIFDNVRAENIQEVFVILFALESFSYRD
jgi:hypothetical protein